MRIDDKFMNEVGLADMPEDEKRMFMEHAEEELEVRVGRTLGMALTDEQMEEFEQIQDQPTAAKWLERNAPNFREVVRQVYQSFKEELLAERAQILG